MSRILLLIPTVLLIAGCGTEYRREIAAEALSKHRFVRIEFKQGGYERRFPLRKINWGETGGFTLVADDGWRLIVRGPNVTGFNRSLDDENRASIRFNQGGEDRLWLVDPQGRHHPVAMTLGELAPPSQHLSQDQLP